MKNIFTEQDSENFDFEDYYNEDMAKADNIWIGGNSEFIELNRDLRRKVVEALTDIYCVVKDANYSKRDAVAEYMVRRLNGKAYNKNDVTKIWRLAEDFYTCILSKEDGIICEALKMIYGKKFICGTIRGNSQCDWLDYIAPKELEDNISRIESVLFATGVEFVNDEGERFYVEGGSPSRIKEDLAKQTGIYPNSITLKLIDKKHIIYTYV